MISNLNGSKIAYFSMEIGVRNDIPTYSGGLGVLAGDVIRSSADLMVPMVAVALVSRKGYLRQKLSTSGEQQELPEEWNPDRILDLAPKMVEVNIEGRAVKVQAWIYEHKSTIGGTVPILFLDTNVGGNEVSDRTITDTLYGGDDRYRLKQEIILGVGGVRMLEALGYKISKFHMNEGHAAFLALELLQRFDYDIDKVRRRCVFTTHTPIEAAFDKWSYDLVAQVIGREFPVGLLKELAGDDKLNMTALAFTLSGFQNGVTKMHTKYTLKIFPHYNIRAITNGVHSATWTSPSFHEVYDRYIPGWASEPELLVRVDKVPACDIWNAHITNKRNLEALVKDKTGVEMNPDALTIGFARRATGYKRATLVFSDVNRLREINKKYPLQFVFAGKAHTRDTGGKDLIKQIFWHKEELKNEIKIAYLENYDMNIAAKLTSGVDVWLNTPYPPMEASGTSGMKAAHNGVVNFSILDGWWIEGCIEGVTGWTIGPPAEEPIMEEERRKRELEDLYSKLNYLIGPKFYGDRDAWVEMMKNSIGKVAYYFNTDRMMRRYITDAYLV
jgi:glycogen phosphorylase